MFHECVNRARGDLNGPRLFLLSPSRLGVLVAHWLRSVRIAARRTANGWRGERVAGEAEVIMNIDRRTFLSRSAGTLAGVALAGATASARAADPSPRPAATRPASR